MYALDLDILDRREMSLDIIPSSDFSPEPVKSRKKHHRLFIIAASLLICFGLIFFRGDKPYPDEFTGPDVSSKKKSAALADLEHLIVQLDTGQATIRVPVLLESLHRIQSQGIQTINAGMFKRFILTSEIQPTSLDLSEMIRELGRYSQSHQEITRKDIIRYFKLI
jgi:hypothetical protein